MLDLGYGSFGCLVDTSPYPLPAGLGAQMCEGQNYPWSLGRSIFRSFFRFDFELDFGLVLDPFWTRLGPLLKSFWEPKSGQVGSKMRLERSFFRKCRFSRGPTFFNVFLLFLPQDGTQDRLKTGPRRVQER